MTDYYTSQARHYVSVDCIVFGIDTTGLKLLLIPRAFEPAKGQLSLAGGFVGADEGVAQAAQRVLRQLTGIEDVEMCQIETFGEVDREPETRVISVAFSTIVNISNTNSESLKRHNAFWVDVPEIPDLCFDHSVMVEVALKKIRKSICIYPNPILFKLLPMYFTLSQLQNLYEIIMGYKVDKRNFRRHLQDIKEIVETDLIDKMSSRRGARLYRYQPPVSENVLTN